MDDYPPLFLALLLALFCLGAGMARADDESATLTLNPATASVGESVELDLTVTGASSTGEPPELDLPGAYIEYQGPIRHFESHNATITQRVVHRYHLVPQRVGTLTIPAQSIRVGSRLLTTQPATLKVTASGTRATAARNAFAEWVFPKSTVYLGEPLPAELRLYLADDIRWNLRQLAPMSGDGFTMQKLVQQETASQVTRDGRHYNLYIFKTALTAAKPGTITVAPSEISLIAEIRSGSRRARPRGFPDPFDDDLFNFFDSVKREVVTVRTEPVELEVKALPREGRPEHFSGAIGQFKMESRAAPGRVKLGDPVTLTVEISGIGSFDRMGPPYVENGTGWRSYPPGTQFEKRDEAEVSGTKRFEFALIPETAQTELPKVEFSYFDPSTEQYVTLTGQPIPIVVEGGAAPSPVPSPQAGATAAASPQAGASPAPAEPSGGDLLYIRHDFGAARVSFAPVWRRPFFWALQLIPLAALLGLVGWQRHRRWLSDAHGRRIAALREARAEAGRALRRDGPEREFLDTAIRAFRVEGALRLAARGIHREPETLDGETLCREFAASAALCTEIRDAFAAHDRFHYAGNEAAAGAFPETRRKALIEALDQFRDRAAN